MLLYAAKTSRLEFLVAYVQNTSKEYLLQTFLATFETRTNCKLTKSIKQFDMIAYYIYDILKCSIQCSSSKF